MWNRRALSRADTCTKVQQFSVINLIQRFIRTKCSTAKQKQKKSLFGHVVRLDDHTPAHRALSQVHTVHYHRSQQQELAPTLVVVGIDGQDARAIHGSSRSAMVHHSAFLPNGPRLIVMATLCWRNGPLLSAQSDNDDDDDENKQWRLD